MFRVAIFESAQTASQFPNTNQTTGCSRLRRSNTRESDCADDDLPSVHIAKLTLFSALGNEFMGKPETIRPFGFKLTHYPIGETLDRQPYRLDRIRMVILRRTTLAFHI